MKEHCYGKGRRNVKKHYYKSELVKTEYKNKLVKTFVLKIEDKVTAVENCHGPTILGLISRYL